MTETDARRPPSRAPREETLHAMSDATPVAEKRRAVAGPWAREACALLALGAPMALTQVVQFSVNAIDVLMIGRLGPEALAAASLGLGVFFVTWLIGYGPAMAVAPMVSQALGAKSDDYASARAATRMGLFALFLLFPVVCVPFVFTTEIATLLGQPEGPARLAGPYVLALAPGWPFVLAVLLLRNVLAALGRTRAPLFIIIGTTALNAGLNYLLIFGNFGFPRLEVVGAGLASSISNIVGFLSLVLYCRIDARLREADLFRDLFRFDAPVFREVVRLGWPIAVTTAFEGVLFNACVFLMGRIGVNEIAAYQVALNVSAMAFMTALGFSMAGGVRVGLMAGAGDRAGVRRAAVLAIGFSVAVISIIAVCVFAAPARVAALYIRTDNPGNEQVFALVVSFLRMGAAFMVFDAVQVAANQALRGLKDVRAPMFITGVAYWVIGFPTATFLGLASPVGAIGVWWGLLIALAAAAAMLCARLWRLTT